MSDQFKLICRYVYRCLWAMKHDLDGACSVSGFRFCHSDISVVIHQQWDEWSWLLKRIVARQIFFLWKRLTVLNVQNVLSPGESFSAADGYWCRKRPRRPHEGRTPAGCLRAVRSCHAPPGAPASWSGRDLESGRRCMGPDSGGWGCQRSGSVDPQKWSTYQTLGTRGKTQK